MKQRASVRRTSDAGSESTARPGILQVVATMDEHRADLLLEARKLALSLPGVDETTLYDGFCRHWTPAYYLGKSQLFHVHNFRGGLRATVFAGGTKLVPVILDSGRVPQEYRDQLAKSHQGRGVKQVKVDLNTMEDVAALMELARLKHEFL